jgi:2-Cys peroxiredoxin 5
MLRRTAQRLIKVGDKIPEAEVFVGLPPAATKITSLFQGKKVVLFGVPGAFTPGCSKTHLPGYIEHADALKNKLKVSDIYCIASDNSFVMDAWAQAQKADGKVTMISDPKRSFSSLTGLEVDLPVLGGKVSSRFSMVINNNVVEQLFVEPDGKGLTCSLAPNLFSKL